MKAGEKTVSDPLSVDRWQAARRNEQANERFERASEQDERRAGPFALDPRIKTFEMDAVEPYIKPNENLEPDDGHCGGRGE